MCVSYVYCFLDLFLFLILGLIPAVLESFYCMHVRRSTDKPHLTLPRYVMGFVIQSRKRRVYEHQKCLGLIEAEHDALSGSMPCYYNHHAASSHDST